MQSAEQCPRRAGVTLNESEEQSIVRRQGPLRKPSQRLLSVYIHDHPWPRSARPSARAAHAPVRIAAPERYLRLPRGLATPHASVRGSELACGRPLPVRAAGIACAF
jgi:hypothetical protein